MDLSFRPLGSCCRPCSRWDWLTLRRKLESQADRGAGLVIAYGINAAQNASMQSTLLNPRVWNAPGEC